MSANAPRLTAVQLRTERFTLRELRESDATERYLRWLTDADARAYIATAADTRDLAQLRRYVGERCGRDDVLFLGIFDSATEQHIGNVKFEPLDEARSFAVMGILIGDRDYRSRGVAQEVLTATGRWLKANRRIGEILLGVSRGNAAAIRAYEKVGFRPESSPHIPAPPDDVLTMVWRP